MRIASAHDLEALGLMGRASLSPPGPLVSVGMATCGLSAGAGEVFEALEPMAGGGFFLRKTGCIGLCQEEPLLDIRVPGKGRILYGRVDAALAQRLVQGVLQGDLPREGALACVPEGPGEDPGIPGPLPGLPRLGDLPFFAGQQRIVLRNCGWIDPGDLGEYVARGGYRGYLRACAEADPEVLITAMTASGLRGRGGAGFPTGQKWAACREAPGAERFVVCNADEGDPGAYMDRTVLESDPHSVIEGMLIGALAVGAERGYVYVRHEYPLAVRRLREAIAAAQAAGFLGEGTPGGGRPFHLEVVRGAGAFVCGEETALLASLEGGVGEPRPRPPFPAQEGLWGMPTLIQNVKTWATVPVILDRGPEAVSALGVEGNRGTMVFSLVGKVARTGLVEVPLGIPLRRVVEEIGGGGAGGRAVKAVQTGGPSGGCIPAALFDLPITYEALSGAGSMMGSGGMVVLDEETCMVDLAAYFLRFAASESCGKCTPCREGTRILEELFSRVVRGEGTRNDLARIEELARWMQGASLCGLGKTAPNPVLSTLRHFRGEYEAHVETRRCPAGVCRALITLRIDPSLCTGCGLCRKACPEGAIRGAGPRGFHAIDPSACTRCRLCVELCPEGAVRVSG